MVMMRPASWLRTAARISLRKGSSGWDADPALPGGVGLRDITESKKVQAQIRQWTIACKQRVSERTQELLLSHTRLRAFASDLTLTKQRERQRLAAELHDDLAQFLMFGRMKLSHARRRNLVRPQPW